MAERFDIDFQLKINKASKQFESFIKKAERQMDSFGKKAEASFKNPTQKGSKFSGVLSNIGSVVVPAMIGAFAFNKIFDGFSKAITLASDFEENINKVGAVFGPASDKMISFTRNAATQFGISTGKALELAGGVGSVVKAMGFGVDETSEWAQEILQLSTDIGSFNNLPTEDVVRKITSALTGEREGLKSLGIVVNETRLKQEAAAQGITGALNTQQKAMLTLTLIQRDMADAQGDFAKTSGNFANKTKILSAQIENIATSIGKVLLDAVTSILEPISKVLSFFEDLSKTKLELLNEDMLELGLNTDKLNESTFRYRKQLALLKLDKILRDSKEFKDLIEDALDTNNLSKFNNELENSSTEIKKTTESIATRTILQQELNEDIIKIDRKIAEAKASEIRDEELLAKLRKEDRRLRAERLSMAGEFKLFSVGAVQSDEEQLDILIKREGRLKTIFRLVRQTIELEKSDSKSKPPTTTPTTTPTIDINVAAELAKINALIAEEELNSDKDLAAKKNEVTRLLIERDFQLLKEGLKKEEELELEKRIAGAELEVQALEDIKEMEAAQLDIIENGTDEELQHLLDLFERKKDMNIEFDEFERELLELARQEKIDRNLEMFNEFAEQIQNFFSGATDVTQIFANFEETKRKNKLEKEIKAIQERAKRERKDLGERSVLNAAEKLVFDKKMKDIDEAERTQTENKTAEIKKQSKIEKANAIFQGLANTFGAAIAAFNALAGIPIVGPALGAAAAAVARAFGLKQVEDIKATELAEGALVTGPTLALIGESGDEVVTPLPSFLDFADSLIKNAGIDIGGGGTQADSALIERLKIQELQNDAILNELVGVQDAVRSLDLRVDNQGLALSVEQGTRELEE